MTEPTSRIRTGREPRSLGLLAILALVSLIFGLFGGASIVAAQDGVTVTQNEDTNGCQGVREPPGQGGSDATFKQVVGGDLLPGGSATFRFQFPADDDEEEEANSFEIDDCLYLEDTTPVGRWTITAENQQVQEGFVVFDVPLTLPADQVGANYCNHAKGTGTPAGSPGSERKGVACFVMSGELNVTKTDAEGSALGGAIFNVVCNFPETASFLADTVIEAAGGMVSDQADGSTWASTSGGTLDIDVTTGDNGLIYVRAPGGTDCTFTETRAPEGYAIADPSSATLTVAVGDPQGFTFENPPAGGQAPEAPRPVTFVPVVTDAPNTASGALGGGPMSVPLAVVFLLGSVAGLGTLAYTQVRARR